MNDIIDKMRRINTQDVVVEQIYIDLEQMAERIADNHSFVLILNSNLKFSNISNMIVYIRNNGYKILDKYLTERDVYLLPMTINEYVDYYIDYAFIAYSSK